MKSSNKTSFGSELVRFILCAGISALFLLIFSVATSPLAPNNYIGDSAFFILVGQGMTKGMLPYHDFFDMKGPWLFFIEYIGQKICYGRTGALIMQIIGMTVSLFFVDKANRLVLKKKNILIEILMFVPWLFFAAGSFGDGHLTVEMSLPFLAVSMYGALKYFNACKVAGEAVDHNKFYTLWYGFSFGVIAFIRITNAGLIGAILLTMTVYLIANKKIAELFKNVVFFLIGTVIAVAPMCLYYQSKGMLKEMLDTVFVFGFKYSEELGLVDGIWAMTYDFIWTGLLPLLASIAVLIVCKVKDMKYWIFAVSNALITVAAILMGNVYYHYFAMAIPAIIFAVWVLAEQMQTQEKKEKRILAFALAFVLMFAPSYKTYQRVVKDVSQISQARAGSIDEGTTEFKKIIPETERDSVYCHFLYSSQWYAKAQIFPYSKYCDWTDHYIELVPEIGKELNEMFKTNPPKWVVLKAENDVPEYMQDEIDSNYEVSSLEDDFVLYHYAPDAVTE